MLCVRQIRTCLCTVPPSHLSLVGLSLVLLACLPMSASLVALSPHSAPPLKYPGTTAQRSTAYHTNAERLSCCLHCLLSWALCSWWLCRPCLNIHEYYIWSRLCYWLLLDLVPDLCLPLL